MNLEQLNQVEIASLLCVDSRSIRNYLRESPPIPSHGKGTKVFYVWREVLDWRDQRKFASLAAMKPVDSPAKLSPKDRLDLVKAEKAEYDLANIRKETLTVQDYERAMADMITPARLELLAIEPRLRSVIGPEAAARCGEEIRRSLRRLGGEHLDGGVDA